MVWSVVLGLALLAQAEDRLVPACAQVRCKGKAIQDNLRLLQFCVPHGLEMRKAVGEHGDLHYTLTTRVRGERFKLRIVSGPYYPGRLPQWMSGCDVRRWHSPESKGEDCTIQNGSSVSRYVTLNSPMGYAEYSHVPPEVAARFDAVLNSMCWRPWPSPAPH